MLFFDCLNSRHRNIKFTFEKEENGKLPFLDVLLSKSSDTYTTSVYHKQTYTRLLVSYLSFCPLSYKTGLIRTLIDRIRKINNTESGFRNDLNNLIVTLQRNFFPLHVINKMVRNTMTTPIIKVTHPTFLRQLEQIDNKPSSLNFI